MQYIAEKRRAKYNLPNLCVILGHLIKNIEKEFYSFISLQCQMSDKLALYVAKKLLFKINVKISNTATDVT